MNFLDGMLQKDKEQFKRIGNKLLSNCFLCKKNENTKADYYFILKYKEVFKEAFDLFDYRLEINEDYGVVHLTNHHNYNRYAFKLGESIILLILRILYDEKRRELSTSDEVLINLGDIHEKFLSLQIREKMLDKTTIQNAISTLRRFSIIETLDKNLANEDARIIIFDSILMAVRVEDIKQVYEKLDKYKRGGLKNEEADSDETD